MKRILYILKQLTIRDCLSPFIFVTLLIPSLLFRIWNRLRGKKLWLISENGDARDNGYYFYEFIRKEHPDDYCFYAIKKNSAGFDKVKQLGNTIYFGSLKHWLYYMSANLNISSQKNGNPNSLFWYLAQGVLGLYRNRVFLQHGVIKDDTRSLYYQHTKFKYFVCGARCEYDFVRKEFGYPEGAIIYTGLPRWDSLSRAKRTNSQTSILIMPTWRKWLGADEGKPAKVKNFEATEFFQAWNGLLTDPTFLKFIEKNRYKVYFYPHACMQSFLKSFEPHSKDIEIVSTEREIQNFFVNCDLMITDYSSVAFDFAYLKKPVIYYQFDQEEFMKKQYGEGYFSYERDGFGPVCKNRPEVIKSIMSKLDKKYTIRAEEFFELHDDKNCERVYEAIK